MILLAFAILFACAWYWLIRDKDKIKPSSFPLTPEQRVENYQSVRRFLENNPTNPIRTKFPEYIQDIEIARAYESLDKRRASGELSESDYLIELDQLSQKISIPHLSTIVKRRK